MNPQDNPTDPLPNSSVNNGDEKSGTQFGEVEKLESTVSALSAQVDQQADYFKQEIAGLLAQVGALREASTEAVDRDELVLQLRTANQNLVIATFDAQDMQAAAEAVAKRQDEFLAMLAH